MHLNPVAAALDSISLGPSVTAGNLTMIPLLRKDAPPRTQGTPGTHYIVLDTALSSGVVEITEVSEQGSVPELKFVNHGPEPVLIIDGEELVGAKQNRVVNLTILVAAQSALTIPVTCVEAGRWNARSRAFTAAPRTQYASGRGKRVAQVTQSIRDRGDHMSDQAGVWADIAALSSRLHTSSPTGAMEALFDQHSGFIDRCVDACRPVDGQVGALFSIDGRVVGLDLFDRESTLRTLLPKLVRSVAVDALDVSEGVAQPFRAAPVDQIDRVAQPFDQTDRVAQPFDQANRVAQPFRAASGAKLRPDRRRGEDVRTASAAQQFLAVTAAAAQHVSPGVGLGEDVRLSAPAIAGAALVANGAVVHLSAFAVA